MDIRSEFNKGIAYGEEMIHLVKKGFEQIPWKRVPQAIFSAQDGLMSAYAMFSLKMPSLLQFDESSRKKPIQAENLESIYQLSAVPSDTQMRTIVDRVEPEWIKSVFLSIFKWICDHGFLKAYEYMTHQGEKHSLLSIDGTGFFSSHEIHCEGCLTQTNKDQSMTYMHQMLTAALVHPDLKTVIPLAPEAIKRQDGEDKNDCEMNALKRFIPAFRKAHPHLKVIVNLDSLYANNVIIELLNENNLPYIIVVKKTNHKALFSEVEKAAKQGDLEECTWQEIVGQKVKKTKTHRFRTGTDLTLNQQKDAKKVRFCEYWEEINWVDPKGAKQVSNYHCSWITELQVNGTSPEAAQLFVRGGRARWKIENEVHNTLKNQGHHFEHNYGHGKFYLAENFSLLMLLAFLVDQVQQMGCEFFLKVFTAVKRKTRVWETIRNAYNALPWKSWTQLLMSAHSLGSGKGVAFDTS